MGWKQRISYIFPKSSIFEYLEKGSKIVSIRVTPISYDDPKIYSKYFTKKGKFYALFDNAPDALMKLQRDRYNKYKFVADTKIGAYRQAKRVTMKYLKFLKRMRKED